MPSRTPKPRSPSSKTAPVASLPASVRSLLGGSASCRVVASATMPEQSEPSIRETTKSVAAGKKLRHT
eukprot:5612765-Alexandrium_andersonii.AAC.1